MSVVNIIRVITRLAIALFFGTLACSSQVDHDLAEQGRPHWGAVALFGGWVTVTTLVGSYGNPLATSLAIGLTGVAGIILHGRADNLSVAIVGVAGTHLVSPLLAGQGFTWTIWSTLTIVFMVVGLAIIWISYGIHRKRGRIPDEPYEGNESSNGMIALVAVASFICLVGLIALPIVSRLS